VATGPTESLRAQDIARAVRLVGIAPVPATYQLEGRTQSQTEPSCQERNSGQAFVETCRYRWPSAVDRPIRPSPGLLPPTGAECIRGQLLSGNVFRGHRLEQIAFHIPNCCHPSSYRGRQTSSLPNADLRVAFDRAGEQMLCHKRYTRMGAHPCGCANVISNCMPS
jgi:hypothetical protein